MNLRASLPYVIGAVALGLGLWLMSGDGGKHVRTTAAGAGATPPVEASVPGMGGATGPVSGGYLGTGKSQVTFEGPVKLAAAETVPRDDAEVKSPLQMEGEHREAELARVLANIENEPVYVEGVDGPAPAKTPKKK